MKTTAYQRINLIFETFQFSQSSFGSANGIKQTTINSQINQCKKTNSIPKNLVDAVYATCPSVNLDWLITGRGAMYIPSDNVEVIHNFDESASSDLSVIPMFPDWLAATAGFEVQTDGFVPDSQIVLPNMPKCDGAIQVRGDSMYPILKAGDYVCFKMLPADVDAIAYGDMYIIDYELGGDDMVSVKYIDKSDKGDGYIKLVSYNQHYAPVDVPLASVRHIARVKISIRLH